MLNALFKTQCDQPKEGIAASAAKMDEYCKDKGFAGWFETSAKDNINIDDAAKFLVGTVGFASYESLFWNIIFIVIIPIRFFKTTSGVPALKKRMLIN